MTLKFKINVLFFCLYLGSVGKYFLNQFVYSRSIDTLINIIIDFLIIVLTLSFIKMKSKYMNYIYVFIIFSTLSYIISENKSLLSHINGIRETLVFICYFVIMDVLYRTRQIEKINEKFIIFSYFFLTIQIPIAIQQFIKFGAGDAVGGTFGYGGSGILTFSIFILIYYLIENKIGTSKERLKKSIPFLIFLIPIALNETKISFIIMLIYFISFMDIKSASSSLLFASFGVLSVISFSYIYTTQGDVGSKNPIEDFVNKDFLNDYLLGDETFSEDIPRFTKIVIGTNLLVNDGNLLLGKDFGAFMGSELKLRSKFTKNYEWLLSGSKPYSFYLLITGGIFHLLLVISIVFSEIFRKCINRIKNYSSSLLFFLTALFLILFFYNDSLRTTSFSFLFVFVLFFAKHFRNRLKLSKFKVLNLS
jgi:hypothetical protein